MSTNSTSQPGCFSTAEPPFDFLRDQVYRGHRFVGTVLGEQIVARKFVVNSRPELTRRTIRTNLMQLHPCP
jgi:hypothetical protein